MRHLVIVGRSRRPFNRALRPVKPHRSLALVREDDPIEALGPQRLHPRGVEVRDNQLGLLLVRWVLEVDLQAMVPLEVPLLF